MSFSTILSASNGNLTSMVNLADVIILRTERLLISGRSNTFATCYVIKCVVPDCQNEVRIYKGKEKKPTGKCKICSVRRAPYQHIFGLVRAAARTHNRKFDLSFDDFLKFTSITKCLYCDAPITWRKWTSGKDGCGGKYNLDRKDSSLGYSYDNCVVCCTDCNYTKGARFTFAEFILLSPTLKIINEIRNR